MRAAARRSPAAASPPARSPRSPPPASSRWRSASSSARTRRTRCPRSPALWKRGVETTVDLLGEATVTEAEADRYAAPLRGRAAHARGRRDHEPGQVNLSVKVSALTPLLRPEAPERGIEGARPRLRHLLRVAREVGAHLHVDMESFDTREAITRLTLDLLVRARVRRTARPPGSSCRPTSSTPRSTSRSCSTGPASTRARTRSRSASSRAPTGTTRSSRPRSTAGRRRSSPTAASATATSRRCRSA